MALQIDGIMNEKEGYWYKNNNVSGTGDDAQVPWGRGAIFYPNPISLGTFVTGYLSLPESFWNFKLDRSTVIREQNGKQAKIPLYVTNHYDAQKIKRVVIVWPGKWRDSWRYINMMGNAYLVAQKYPELNVNDGEVYMMSPVFFNQLDELALKDDELRWKDYGWSAGGTARSPEEFKHISSFEVIDHLIEMSLDTSKFPNVEKVVVVGHSMGAQANLRYAILKRPKKYDDRVKYWIGDPGSVIYFDEWRPVMKHNCSDYNSWPYGLNDQSSVPLYNRKRAGNGGAELVKEFNNRVIRFGVALDDNGRGNNHCQSKMQGPNRIARSSQWISHRGDSWPSSHSVDYVPGVSHQDYVMMAYYYSMKFIFSEDDR
ncbi:hypothetical protein MCUN1_000101 [Malassezia cuniculi]|uniref:Uncharacterized protein n=1 Tax=Malassezia cuniculi TaxID=948313 RepID=A0AAF0EME1_9BASI|nr:hypothetical protein MCUN1_000101 [Malassezia cuniculi]